MIRSLRKKHTLIFIVLPLVLALVFIIAISVRQSVPTDSDFPNNPITYPEDDEIIMDYADFGDDVPIKVRVFKVSPEIFQLELKPGPEFKQPDPLVYWSLNGDLSEGLFLGNIQNNVTKSYPIPDQALGKQGVITIFSPAFNQSIGEMKITLPPKQETPE